VTAQHLQRAPGSDSDTATAEPSVAGDLQVADTTGVRPPPPPPPAHELPGPPRPLLGREELIDTLADRLRRGDVSLQGRSGVGKSTLAARLAQHPHVRAQFTEGVLWAGLGRDADVMSILDAWGARLGVDVIGLPTPEARAEALVRAMREAHLLLVIDDAWDPEHARLLRCGGPGCAHLLTTCVPDLAHGFAASEQVLRVPELEIEHAFALLQERLSDAQGLDAAAIYALAEAAGGLPTSLDLIAGFVAARGSHASAESGAVPAQDLADTERRLALVRAHLGSGDRHVDTIRHGVMLNLDDMAEPLVAAFEALGAFAPRPADFDLDAARAVSEASVETLAALVARGLVEQAGPDRLALPQSVADVARGRVSDDAIARHRAHYLAVIEADPENWDGIASVYPQLRWAWQQLTGAAELPQVLTLLWACRDFQQRRGLWQDITAWTGDALERARSDGGPQLNALLLNTLGQARDVLGDRRQALDYHDQALTLSRDAGDKAGQAMVLNDMGLDHAELGETPQALACFQQALALVRALGDRTGEATILSNTAALHAAADHKQEALACYEAALPICRQLGDRAGEAAMLASVGALRSAMNDKTRALECYDAALTLLRRLGDKSSAAATLTDMAEVYDGLGEAARAVACYDEALRLCCDSGDRWSESAARYNLARLHEALGDLAEAETQLCKVVALDEAIRHPLLESHRADLARLQQQRARKRPFWMGLFGGAGATG